MAIALAGTPAYGGNAFGSSASTAVPVPIPAGVTLGELLVVSVTSGANTGSGASLWTPPAGWTTVGQTTTTGSSNPISVFCKFATATEVAAAGSTLTFTADKSAIYWASNAVRFTGVDTTTPLDMTPSLVSMNSPLTTPATATVTTGAYVIAALDVDDIPNTATLTQPAGWTVSVAGNGANLTNRWSTRPEGSIPSTVWNWVASWGTGAGMGAVVFALRPAAGGGGAVTLAKSLIRNRARFRSVW